MEEKLCAYDADCPGGHFCGKTKVNPNNGVTNYDNIAYSLINTFQCVTLEGWSSIMRDVQITYVYIIWIFYILEVVLGAFFLLNLTLAVITSKFTEAHNEHQAQEKLERERQSKSNELEDDELDNLNANQD